MPELGCLPDYQPPLRWATICAAQARGEYPQLALDKFDTYLQNHLVDTLDLSTGLLTDKTYQRMGRRRGDRAANGLAGGAQAGLGQGRAAAGPQGARAPGQVQRAPTPTQTVATFIDIPKNQGAVAVDVWTWRQKYQGDIYRLLDPGLQPNSLWASLQQRRASGAVLFTHLSPQSVEVGLDADLKVLSEVFTDLFVAAGTG